MREILFRGKNIDTGEWVHGIAFPHDGGRCTLTYRNPKDGSLECREVDLDTVGQYTGINDKDGARIYEGDILQARLDDRYPDSVTTCVVEWHTDPHIGWFIRQAGRACKPDPLDKFDSKYWEIVGNIHDNPDMLERKA